MKISLGEIDGQLSWVTEDAMGCHVFICGKTGSGKSRMLTSILLQLAMGGRGFLLIDKDDTTAEATFGHLTEWQGQISPAQWRKIYPLFVGSGTTFRFDPFVTSLVGTEYEAWLARTVESVGNIMARKQGLRDFKDQLERYRVMRDVLYMVGTRRKDRGHMGLDRAVACLTLMGSRKWEALFNSVCNQLPEERARSLWECHKQNKRDRWNDIRSTVNIFDAFLSFPAVKQMLKPGDDTLDLMKAVEENAIILAPLGYNPFFGEEQGDAIAALLISGVVDACWFRKDKSPYYMAIEEAETILGHDFGTILTRGRKNGCIGIFLVQHVEELKRD